MNWSKGFFRICLVLSVVNPLSGCTLRDAWDAEQAKGDINKCAGFGFQPDTPQMAQCRLTLSQERHASFDAGIDGMSRSMNTASQGYYQRSYAAPAPAPSYVIQPQQTYCQTNPNGGGYSTTCY